MRKFSKMLSRFFNSARRDQMRVENGVWMFECPSQSCTNRMSPLASKRCVTIECLSVWKYSFSDGSFACRIASLAYRASVVRLVNFDYSEKAAACLSAARFVRTPSNSFSESGLRRLRADVRRRSCPWAALIWFSGVFSPRPRRAACRLPMPGVRAGKRSGKSSGRVCRRWRRKDAAAHRA